MKEEVNECSEQISEKCNELFNIQATLASCKENHKHEIESYETEMEKVEEDTRSLKVKLEKIQEENDLKICMNALRMEFETLKHNRINRIQLSILLLS